MLHIPSDPHLKDAEAAGKFALAAIQNGRYTECVGEWAKIATHWAHRSITWKLLNHPEGGDVPVPDVKRSSQPFCPTCSQLIGGRGLLVQEIETLRGEKEGLKSLHKRELDLRVATEKIRDQIREERDALQMALDTAEEDLSVLGTKLARTESELEVTKQLLQEAAEYRVRP